MGCGWFGVIGGAACWGKAAIGGIFSVPVFGWIEGFGGRRLGITMTFDASRPFIGAAHWSIPLVQWDGPVGSWMLRSAL